MALAAARVDEREKTIGYLRSFPPTDGQRPGIEAVLVWLTIHSADAAYPTNDGAHYPPDQG